MNFDIKVKNMEQIKKMLDQLPKYAARAKNSAAKSTGYVIRGMLREFIEKGGENWKQLHPLSKEFTSKEAKAAALGNVNVNKADKPQTPLFFLARFSRYAYDPNVGLQLGLGRTNKGKIGKLDSSFLNALLKKHEMGMTIPVTAESRTIYNRLAIAAGIRPMRATTTEVTVPQRPIIGPVFAKAKDFAPRHFEEKFFSAIDRYMSGKPKK